MPSQYCLHSVDSAGKQVKACFGTTKYCNAFLKGVVCNNPECLYLHDIGECHWLHVLFLLIPLSQIRMLTQSLLNSGKQLFALAYSLSHNQHSACKFSVASFFIPMLAVRCSVKDWLAVD